MQDLTPVGLSQDGRRLVLVSASGEAFQVPVDTRFRAALRGENARLGQLEMKMESALRPRDIQARIRAGESPTEVATAAQTTVEAIMTFAGPVLAERAHIARQAQRASVRRRSNEASSSSRTLGEAAETYFSTLALHDEDLEWDAWRRPDGRWALVVAFSTDGRARRAEFTHDVAGRFVVADNDEARLLTGEMRAPESRSTRDAGPPARRLTPVPSQDELPLGDDALELVRDREGAPPAEPDPAADTADADWMGVAADGAAPVEEPLEVPEEVPTEDEASSPEERQPEPTPETDERPQPEPQPAVMEEKADRHPTSKKKGRSSVPTWDEIMFGGGKGE